MFEELSDQMFGKPKVIESLVWRGEMTAGFLAEYLQLRETAITGDLKIQDQIDQIKADMDAKKAETIVGEFKIEILNDYL